jgi:hypothetical protein
MLCFHSDTLLNTTAYFITASKIYRLSQFCLISADFLFLFSCDLSTEKTAYLYVVVILCTFSG